MKNQEFSVDRLDWKVVDYRAAVTLWVLVACVMVAFGTLKRSSPIVGFAIVPVWLSFWSYIKERQYKKLRDSKLP